MVKETEPFLNTKSQRLEDSKVFVALRLRVFVFSPLDSRSPINKDLFMYGEIYLEVAVR